MTSLPYFDAQAVIDATPYPALIDALDDAFRADWVVPQRSHYDLGAHESTLLLMPAWNGRDAIGTKIATVFPANASAGVRTVHATYLLLCGRTGRPLAVMDGAALTDRRTAAASALASRFLSRGDARVLLLIGAGAIARELAVAHCAVRPIERVLICSRGHARAMQLQADLNARGLATEVVDDLPVAVSRADIVSCATTASEPVLRGAWLRAGTHVDLVGGFKPTMREADDEVMARASVVFLDMQAGGVAEAGDIVLALASGALTVSKIGGDLHALCRGLHAGRADGADITVFKSVGTAIEDLAAAQLVYAARKQEIH